MTKNLRTGDSPWLMPAVVCADALFGLACAALVVGAMHLVARCAGGAA